MAISEFRKRFTEEAGIVRLMDDLGDARTGRSNVLMLGGGNPAHIPEVLQYLKQCLARLAVDQGRLANVIGDYDPPQGDKRFIGSLARYLRRQYGWDIGPENIALTTGSQMAFFMLFNMFSGKFDDGIWRKILLPLVPEYIGYANVGVTENAFIARKPALEMLPDHEFKYHVDFSRLEAGPDIGAICVSRPTNPTGNVIPDEEMEKLLALSRRCGVPFIVDNAYGMPFPDILFTPASLVWDEQIVLCMSLSKLGLPGVRTGIIVANTQIISAITRMNAILSLAPGSIGPALVHDLIESGRIADLCSKTITPYYRCKSLSALALLKRELAGIDFYLHKPEGAIFLWLWIPGLPISCEQLYRRLKQRGVLVVPGHYFFPGLEEDWPQRHECIRISYAMQDNVVEQGIRIIADEVKKIVREGKQR